MTQRPRFQLTPDQYARLTMPLDTNRVGKNPKGFSHLEAWDVRRWLIRVFGFGSCDIETISLDLVKEIEHPARRRKDKKGNEYGDPYVPWTVVYRAQVRLTVYDQFGGKVVLEDGACGDSTNQPSLGDCHDNASKTALSQALKRCAVNLGDCFGLSLYNGGGAAPVVLRSLVAPAADASPAAAELPAEDAPVRPEPGTEPAGDVVGEHQEPAGEPDTRPVSAPPAARPESGPPAALTSAATALLDDIQTATDETGLRRVWKAAGEDAKTGHISQAELEHFRTQWKARKDELFPPAPKNPGNDPARRRMFALLGQADITDRDDRLAWVSEIAGRELASTNDLTDDEVARVIERAEAYLAQNTPPAESQMEMAG